MPSVPTSSLSAYPPSDISTVHTLITSHSLVWVSLELCSHSKVASTQEQSIRRVTFPFGNTALRMLSLLKDQV